MTANTATEAAEAAAARQSWPLDSSCPRARAFGARALIPAHPHLAAALGLGRAVAYTGAVHRAVIAWSEKTEAGKRYPTGQDELARERDVLFMAAAALRREDIAPAVAFTVYAVPATGPDVLPVVFDLVVLTGSGDYGEAMVTITSATQHQARSGWPDADQRPAHHRARAVREEETRSR